ncbi:hypothetical protein FRX31_030423 [Thalictrum thalictroides]|uniref:Protein-tyrosine-phosphatase MKP1 C-terminal domain-containing protein n=1 Tax=Thalictrum thalictroides TaxID=46969 RepID=A0A7J6V5F9_THATH|nr:hypothetical protein FRX31_030423 [Thalictrum thalictroides]
MCSPRPRDGLSCNVGLLVETHDELGRSCHLQDSRQVSVSTGSMDNGPKLCNGVQPLVRRWPGLEKISPFGTSDLDSNSAFLFSPPSIGASKRKDGKPFLWIGKFFKHDSSLNQLNNKLNIGEVEEVDWRHIHSDTSSLMGLPKDIPIKVTGSS